MSALGAFRFVLHSYLPYSRMAVHWPHREEWIHAAAKDSSLLSALFRLVEGEYITAIISTPTVAPALDFTMPVDARKRYEGDNDDLEDDDLEDDDFEDDDFEDDDDLEDDFDDDDDLDDDLEDDDFDDDDFDDDDDFEDAYRVRQPDRRWVQIDVLVNDPRKMRMAKYN